MTKIHFETIDSTNNYLKRNFESLTHFTWVTAATQTGGKGRLNRSWFGNQDSLLCSILFKDEVSFEWVHLIPLLAAKSLHQVLSKFHTSIKIKWPNDLLINQKKVAGILVESVTLSNQVIALIIGFGVNLNQKYFENELKDLATSLYIESNQFYLNDFLLNLLSIQLKEDFADFKENPIDVIKYCNRYLAFKNEEIFYTIKNENHIGKVTHIGLDGHLNMLTKDGVNHNISQEIRTIKYKNEL